MFRFVFYVFDIFSLGGTLDRQVQLNACKPEQGRGKHDHATCSWTFSVCNELQHSDLHIIGGDTEGNPPFHPQNYHSLTNCKFFLFGAVGRQGD